MPIAAIGIGLGTALAGGASAGAMVYGAHKQSSAQNKAAKIEDQYAREALAFEKERDAYQRRQYEEERARNWGIENEDRSRRIVEEDARRGRLAPFQQFGAGGVSALSSMLAVPGQAPMQAPASQPLAGTPAERYTGGNPDHQYRVPDVRGGAAPRPGLSGMLMQPQRSTVRTPRLRY